jgi:asparagine synthase (glutamine-hydrolysing)
MSFLAVFNSDGSPVDLDQLKWVVPAMGTENVQVLGFGRQVAFLGSQPASALPPEDPTCCEAFGKRLWVIGRFRLDAREELCSIVFGSYATFEQRSDAYILLGAYARWGDRCLDHMRGDFCFVLWDQSQQRLFCGRDQLGVRPLFYATHGSSWIVSDCLEIIVAQAVISVDVDDFWIADFLSFGFCNDPDRTVYKQIKRLPAAHSLSVRARNYVVQRYWTLENRDPIYYPRAGTYLEHFREVTGRAVRDRLPHGRVGISLSGGLDSSTLAVVALRATGDASKIIAHTRHFEYLMEDAEKHFSCLVARKLGIPLVLRAVDDAYYDPYWYNQQIRTPEPTSAIVRAVPQRIIATEMAELTKVWFLGEGPDNALVFEWQAYLRFLFTRMDWFHLSGAVVEYLLSKQIREWRSTVSNIITRHRPTSEEKTLIQGPLWFNEDFIEEHRLMARTGQLQNSPNDQHAWHPRAFASFKGSRWQSFLEQFDPSVSGTGLTWRHPYLDLRVLNFLLSVPPIPWARRKRLVREAMRDCLPKEVISRDKAPLSGNPLARTLRKYGLPQLSLDGPIRRYVDSNKLPKTLPDERAIRPLVRVYVLDSWLKSKLRRSSVERGSDIRQS